VDRFYCPHTEDQRPPCPKMCPMRSTHVCPLNWIVKEEEKKNGEYKNLWLS